MNNLPLRKVGQTALKLPILGFGGAPLGELFRRVSETQSCQTLQSAWSAGIRYYDTAPWYGHGLSEHRIGWLLRQKDRDCYLCSTKVGRVYSRFEVGPKTSMDHRGPVDCLLPSSLITPMMESCAPMKIVCCVWG